MICEECPLAEGCIERRGLCRDYIRYMERVEEVRKRIEQLNTGNKKTAGRSGTNKGSVQEAGPVQQQQAHESGKAPLSVQPKTDTGAEEKAGGTEGKEAGQNSAHTQAPKVDG